MNDLFPGHSVTARLALVTALFVLVGSQSLVRCQEPAPAGKDKDAAPAPAHTAVYAQEYYHSFKGDAEISPEFHWHGLEPRSCVEFEPDGMRISLPAGHPGKRMGTGVGLNTCVKGDFEVTLQYEILKEPDAVDAGAGTGVFVWVDLQKPKLHRGFVSRVSQREKQFVTWFRLTPDPPQKPVDVLRRFPATQNRGRLRIVRTASVLYYYVAEGLGEDFKLLQQHPFGAEDLQAVRWGGQTGGPDASLEGRFIDLRIRADGLPELPDLVAKNPAALPEQGADAPGVAGVSWLPIGIGVAVAILLLSAIGVLILRRRQTPVATAPNEAHLAVALVSFACTDCGKRLKARPDFAGKKVKCPQCGAAAQVPANVSGG